jgi:DAACS family dicarboxylate/amino acid:cation (Na+ or H+) symporter
MICGIIGLKPEGIAIILGVNTFLDMCRTALNVTGDLATAVVVSHRAGERPDEVAVLDQADLEQAGLEQVVTELDAKGRPDRRP